MRPHTFAYSFGAGPPTWHRSLPGLLMEEDVEPNLAERSDFIPLRFWHVR